jgi:hypothetical protein
VTFRPWFVLREGNPGQTNFSRSAAFRRVTDADGLVIFDWLPHDIPGDLSLWFDARGYFSGPPPFKIRWKDLDESKTYQVLLQESFGSGGQTSKIGGRVIDDLGQPALGATIVMRGHGANPVRGYGRATSQADGRFAVNVPTDQTYVLFAELGQKVACSGPLAVHDGKPVSDIEIKLQRGTVVQGKVTRGDPPQPISGQWVSMRLELEKIPEEKYTVHSPVPSSHGRLSTTLGTVTDAEGNFQFLAAPGEYYLSVKQKGYLIQEQAYRFPVTDESPLKFHINFRSEKKMDLTSGPGRWYRDTEFVGNGQQTINLGEKRVIPDDGSTLLKDRIAAIFANSNSLADRLTQLKHESARDFTRIAVILANRETTQSEWFYRLLRGTNEDREWLNATDDLVESIRAGMNDFRQMWLDPEKFPELRSLVPSLPLPANSSGALILLDSDGAWLSSFQPGPEANPDLDLRELLATIQAHQLPKRDAAVILANAKSQAARDGKRILLQETATWCGPCHQLSRFIEQHREIFDRHFVWIRVDRERMLNAESILQNFRSDGARSIPWIAILDSEGVVLGTSVRIPDTLLSTLGSIIPKLRKSEKIAGPRSAQVEELRWRLEDYHQKLAKERSIEENFGFLQSPKTWIDSCCY